MLWPVFLLVFFPELVETSFFRKLPLKHKVRSSIGHILLRLGLCSHMGRLCLCPAQGFLTLIGMGMMGNRSVLHFLATPKEGLVANLCLELGLSLIHI